VKEASSISSTSNLLRVRKVGFIKATLTWSIRGLIVLPILSKSSTLNRFSTALQRNHVTSLAFILFLPTYIGLGVKLQCS
jgi:hypothetical protein